MLNQIFPALAAHGMARNYGNLLLSTLKTSFSYFEKMGFSGLLTWPVSRQVLNQIFPALAAHGIARNYGNLLLSTLKTSFSYFEKIGFSGLLTWPVSRQVLNQIFPALAAHGIARNYGNLLLSTLKNWLRLPVWRISILDLLQCQLEGERVHGVDNTMGSGVPVS